MSLRGFNRMVFVHRSDDIAGNRAEHGIALLRRIRADPRFLPQPPPSAESRHQPVLDPADRAGGLVSHQRDGVDYTGRLNMDSRLLRTARPDGGRRLH
jgi:hypothetical protein